MTLVFRQERQEVRRLPWTIVDDGFDGAAGRDVALCEGSVHPRDVEPSEAHEAAICALVARRPRGVRRDAAKKKIGEPAPVARAAREDAADARLPIARQPLAIFAGVDRVLAEPPRGRVSTDVEHSQCESRDAGE